ncbi:MAG: hypothetical protein NUV74_14510 [Candidatus Brocadiaceae bacterium]|nr:hypothetical protein [Candidatus Brocadiaceae bacterium]
MNIKQNFSLWFIFCLLFLIGCETPESKFKRAEINNSLESLDEIVSNYPNSEVAERAKKRLTELQKDIHLEVLQTKITNDPQPFHNLNSLLQLANNPQSSKPIQRTLPENYVYLIIEFQINNPHSNKFSVKNEDFILTDNKLDKGYKSYLLFAGGWVSEGSDTLYAGERKKVLFIIPKESDDSLLHFLNKDVIPINISKSVLKRNRPETFLTTLEEAHDSYFWDSRATIDVSAIIKENTSHAIKQKEATADVYNEIQNLSSHNPATRTCAAVSLGKMGVKALYAIPYLIDTLADATLIGMSGKTFHESCEIGDSVWFPSYEAEIALIRLGSVAQRQLIDALKGDNLGIRCVGEGIQEKTKYRRMGDLAIRIKAAQILGTLKDPRSIEPLITVLKEENADIRTIATESLIEITGQNFGENHEKWQKWWSQNKVE